MSDIVERLRAEASDNKRYLVPDGLALEAADEITTLRAEVERLRAALEWIAGTALTEPEAMADKARAALGEEGK